ncbi:MAG: sulfide:quinone reductase [Bacteroidales bacterium]
MNEKDMLFTEEFSRFVNGKMCSAKKTGNELANDHRYLVNEKFKVLMAFMERLASDYKSGDYDLRNEWACKLASQAIDSLVENELYYVSND